MKNIIFRISRSEFESLKAQCKKSGRNETQAFVLCSRAESENEIIHLAKHLILPDKNDFEEQSATSVIPTAEFQATAYGAGYDLGLSVFDVHTHPFAETACLSPTDYSNGKKNGKCIAKSFPPECPMGMIVFNRSMDSFDGVVWNKEKNDFDKIDVLEILGSPIQILPKPEIPTEEDTYSRHRIIPGWNQEALGQLKILVAGLGGNGSLVFQALLGLGIGKNGGWIQACDPDVIEESNIPRIPYAIPQDVGKTKAEIAQLYAIRKAPSLPVKCHEKKLEEMENIAKEAHILIGTIDREGGRKFFNSISNRYLVPYIDVSTEIISEGGQYQSLGQAHVGIPGQAGCLMCSGLIDVSEAAMDDLTEEQHREREEAGYVRGTNETPTPSVLHLNGVASNLAISKMIDLVFGRTPEKGFLNYTQQDYSLMAVSNKSNPDCPVCGDNGYLGEGDRVVMKAVSDGDEIKTFRMAKENHGINARTKEECNSIPRGVT